MARFEKFLFFYSTVAVTTLFISYGVFEKFPVNLISSISLLPILIYFWLRLTNPEKLSAEAWSLRLLAVLTILIALGIGAFWLSKRTPPTPPPENVLPEATLKPTPVGSPKTKAADTSISDLIFETASPSALLRITGKGGVKSIDVYVVPKSSSGKVGTLDGSLSYPYLEKQTGWYKVAYTSSQAGWVSVTEVQEVN